MGQIVLLIVGLDGASYDLCERWIDERWIEQGHLPNLARIKYEGKLVPLKSTIPSVSPVAWSTFMTGSNPGEHGVFGFFVPERPGPYEPPTYFRPVNSGDCHGKRFWEKMNEAGLSTGIVGVPVTYPVQPVQGHMVAGLLAPHLSTPGATYPPGLSAEITAEVGPYRTVPRGIYASGGEQLLMRELHTCLELRGRLAQYLLDNHRCDVHVFILYETDVVQHKMWRFMDSSHPRYDYLAAQRWGSAIREIYTHADSIVGQLMRQLGQQDSIIVVSDHGSGALHGTVHLNSWLAEEGYLVPNRGGKEWLLRFSAAHKFVQGCTRILRQMGVLGRISIDQKKRRLVASGFLTADSINWKCSEAYSLGFEGAIYTVGENHAAITEKIAAGLKNLEEPDSGGPLVDSVCAAQDVYAGDWVEYGPSLILRLAGGRYNASQKMFAPQLVSTPTDSGTHSPTGILGAWGPAAAVIEQDAPLHIQAVAQLVLETVGIGEIGRVAPGRA